MHPRPALPVDTSGWHEYDRAERIRHLRGQLARIIQAMIAEQQRAMASSDQVAELEHLELIVRRAADCLIELGNMGPALQAMTVTLEHIRDLDPESELGRGLTLFLEPKPGGGGGGVQLTGPLEPAPVKPLVPTGFR